MTSKVSEEEMKNITRVFSRSCSLKNVSRLEKLYGLLDSNNMFFIEEEMSSDDRENQVLFFLDALLKMLAVTGVDNTAVCEVAYKMISLIVDLCITYCGELVNPCSRYLDLFVDLSEAVLSINEHSDMFSYPIKFLHFKHDVTKYFSFERGEDYLPLIVKSNKDVFALFTHSIRISTALYKHTRHFQHENPNLYNMISVSQLWYAVAKEDIHINTALVALGTAVCLAEFTPIYPQQNTTLLAELESLLGLLTSKQFHKQYLLNSASPVFPLLLEKVCEAMEVFKIAILELDLIGDVFTSDLSASFFSPTPLSLPAPVATIVSQLLHDCLLLSPVSSFPTISLIDNWHRSGTLCHAPLLPVVTASCLYAYTHLRSTSVGYPHSTYGLLYTIASAHIDDVSEYSVTTEPASLDKLNSDMIVLDVILETTLRLVYSCFSLNVSSKEISNYETKEIYEIGEIEDLCKMTSDALLTFSRTLCHYYQQLPANATPLLLNSCKCFASLICIYSSKLFLTPLDQDYVTALLECVESLVMFSTYPLDENTVIGIIRVLQVLPAAEKNPKNLFRILEKLLSSINSAPPPNLMLALTSSLSIFLKLLPDDKADKIADQYCVLVKNCSVTEKPWMDFSLELAAHVPIITALLSAPNTVKVGTCNLPSHHLAPLSSSVYTLHYRPDSGGRLSNLISQSQDFLKVIKVLYTARKLPLPTQVAVVTSLFDLSFILPPSHQFIPSLLKHIFLYSSYTLALLLTKPIDQLLDRVHASASRKSSLLDDASLHHLVEVLDGLIYKASSSQKLLSIQCYQDLVYGLNKIGHVEEAVTIIKKMLHCASTEIQTVACEKIREILCRDREAEDGEYGILRTRTFAAIPSFLASDVFEQQLEQDHLTEYLNVLTTALNLNGPKELFKHMMCRLVQLIFKRDFSEQKKLQLLNLIADHTETTVSDILLRNFSNLYSDLFINSSEQEQMDRKFEFLKQHCTGLSGALLVVESDLFSKLALNIAKNHTAVNEGVKKYFSIAYPHSQPPKIEDLINKRFLSMLKCLEDLNSNTTEEQQLIFVKSLDKLIGLLNVKCISTAPHKLMASLTYFLQHRDERIVVASFSAWKTFTSHLALPSEDPIWIHIIVTLYQSMCEHKIGHKLINTYSELIFKHNRSLHSSASYVYTAPLPEAPVYDELRKKLLPDMENANRSPLIRRLEQICKGLSHEALSVRKFVLEALLQIIESNTSEISTLILSGPFVDRVISKLIQTLVRSFELKQEQMNIQLTKCIGVLGAVDPARLGIERRRQESSSLPICRDLTANPICAINILTELTRYLATNTVQSEDQDFVCHAIQQVMTAYKIPNPQSGMRIRVEKEIDSHVWDVIQPYLDSKYSISGDNSFVSDEELESLDLRSLSPIYSTEITKTHHHWLSRFSKRLASFIIQPSAKLLFQTCVRLIAMINTNIGYMLLPHIVIHIMLDKNFSEDKRTHILDVVYREFDSVLNIADAELNQASRKPGEVTHLKMIVDVILNVLNFLSQLKNEPSMNLTREEVKVVESLSCKFPLLTLVSMATYCNIFPLALRYMEQYIQEEGVCLKGRPDIRKRLGNLYELLEDRESILGLQAFRRELPSLEESILEQFHANNISGVVSCYKKGIQQQPHNCDLQLGLIRTQLEFGFEYDADLQLRHLNGKESLEMKEVLPYQLEACWKLSQWDEIDRLVRNPESGSLELEVESYSNKQEADWKLGLGVLLNCAERRHETEFLKQLEGMRKQRASLLSSYSLKCVSNDECYQELVKLCMLRELEEGVKAFIFSQTDHLTESQLELFSRWDRSLLCTRKSYKIREPILSLRKAILSMSCLVERRSLCILEIAKLSRRCGIKESGDTMLSKLGDLEPNEPLWLLSNLEKAKFIYKFGSGILSKTFSSAAVEHLQKILSIAKTVTGIPAEIKVKWDSLLKKIQLYQFRCQLDQKYRDNSAIQKELIQFVTESPHLDKALFTLAEFQFELASDEKHGYSESESSNQSKFDITLLTILNYFKLVKQNNKYVITSMPKAISFWLISANQLFSKKGNPQFDEFFKNLNEAVRDHYQDLQPYHLYSAFSVLLSHISGTDPETFKVLSKVIHYVYDQYPTICVWFMIPLVNSTVDICRQRMENIFNGTEIPNLPSARKKQLIKVYRIAILLTRLMARFPTKEVSKKMALNHINKLSYWNKELYEFRYSADYPLLVLPIEYCFQFPIHSTSPSSDKLPTIQRFDDFCMCYRTLKLPHRFRIQASDGCTYDFLYKSGEDVRKDNRSMEIFMHMNLLMKKDPRCNERISFIRTFAVVPLGETRGLIEWVENRTEIKGIIVNLYETAEQPLKRSYLMKGLHENAPMEDLKVHNKERFVKCSPPVFHKWFYMNFPFSTDWYLARQEYTRSVAVMSMGGYIMGLGDRHLENMLISTQTGHVMHVDFGILFGEGKGLGYPEVVPYRLTHNLVDGMGVLGYEGCFRTTCESVLRCFRDGYQSLYPILRNMHSEFDTLNTSKMDGVHSRLEGHCGGRMMSVEDQVQFTIQQATSPDLIRMFHGWASFL